MHRNMDDIERETLIGQASAWQARHLSAELTPSEKVEFLRWLQESPRNVREYLEHARIMKLLPQAFESLDTRRDGGRTDTELSDSGADEGKVVPFTRAHRVAASQAVPATSPRRIGARGRVGLAAAIVVACAGWYAGSAYLESVQWLTVSVPQGGQRTMRLDDGSVVHLNSGSTARVRYSAGERLVELDEGQALFSVAHDKARPFRVRAGSTEIVALGTEFDVYRQDRESVRVTVVEGRVEVLDRDAANRESGPNAAASAAHPVQLVVGQQLRAGSAASATPAVTTIDVNAATAWVRREIVFNGQPLGEVADEFNRYLSVPVYIEDAALRNTRVSGIFSAYDEEAFIAFLREFDEVDVTVDSRVIRVQSRKTRQPPR
jgi:transmembrane sensor